MDRVDFFLLFLLIKLVFIARNKVLKQDFVFIYKFFLLFFQKYVLGFY